MKIEALTIEHAQAIRPQLQQSDLTRDEMAALAMAQASAGLAYAVVDGDEVAMIGGVVCDESWPCRGVVWSVIADGMGRRMLPLTRLVNIWLDGLPFQRLELYVDAQFAMGCRWARLLGFELETPSPMRKFLPNGNAAYMFGRVQ